MFALILLLACTAPDDTGAKIQDTAAPEIVFDVDEVEIRHEDGGLQVSVWTTTEASRVSLYAELYEYEESHYLSSADGLLWSLDLGPDETNMDRPDEESLYVVTATEAHEHGEDHLVIEWSSEADSKEIF